MNVVNFEELSKSAELNKAASEAFESYECVEWERKPADEYAFKVGFLHGAMWALRLKMEMIFSDPSS